MGQDEVGKILIADNDEDVLLGLERALEDEGYDTAVTVSREAAFQVLSTGAFDLLVLDDYLSDQHCVQVLTHFRGAGIQPMVVVTYHRFPSRSEREQLRSLGVSTLVDKAHTDRTGAHRPLPAAAAGEMQPSVRHHLSWVLALRCSAIVCCYVARIPSADSTNVHSFAIQTHPVGV